MQRLLMERACSMPKLSEFNVLLWLLQMLSDCRA